MTEHLGFTCSIKYYYFYYYICYCWCCCCRDCETLS